MTLLPSSLVTTCLLVTCHAHLSWIFGPASPQLSLKPRSHEVRGPGLTSALPSVLGHHTFGLTPSWDSGATSLTWHEAQQWCRARGLRSVWIYCHNLAHLTIIHRAVSVDSESKAGKVLWFLSRSDQVYFWTGGKKINPFLGDSVRWANGATQDVRQGRYPW